MKISVTIATHNRVELLLRTLDSLFCADWSVVDECPEIIVVENACTDGTVEAVLRIIEEVRCNGARCAGDRPIVSGRCGTGLECRVVSEPRVGLGWARRRCVEESSGDIVAFLDDDVLVDPQWPRGLVSAFAEPAVGAAGGRVIGWWEACARPEWLTPDLEWVVSLYDKGTLFRRQEVPEGIGANFAVRRKVFDVVGSFDGELGRCGKKLSGGEESDLFRRIAAAGFLGVYAGPMMVAHWVAPSRLESSYFARIAYHYGQTRIAIRGRGRGLPYLRSVFGHAALWGGFRLASLWARCRGWECDARRWLVRSQIGRGGLAALLLTR